jgi:hypothetical protein
MKALSPLHARAEKLGRRREPWREAGDEPGLGDVLADPLIHLVMKRDGLLRADLEAAIALGRSLLRRRLCERWAA